MYVVHWPSFLAAHISLRLRYVSIESSSFLLMLDAEPNTLSYVNEGLGLTSSVKFLSRLTRIGGDGLG